MSDYISYCINCFCGSQSKWYVEGICLGAITIPVAVAVTIGVDTVRIDPIRIQAEDLIDSTNTRAMIVIGIHQITKATRRIGMDINVRIVQSEEIIVV